MQKLTVPKVLFTITQLTYLKGDNFMKKHILLEKAHCYTEPTEQLIRSEFIYDEQMGVWVNSLTGDAMMLSGDSCRPMTKKEDRETGEDQKGE